MVRVPEATVAASGAAQGSRVAGSTAAKRWVE
jgi:hypothetical protein